MDRRVLASERDLFVEMLLDDAVDVFLEGF